MTEAPENSIHPETLQDLRQWLAVNGDRETGLWLVLWKSGSGHRRLDYDGLVEELLAFGWIDSKPNKLDEARSLLWIAPRKPGTGWSQINKQRVEKVLAEGRMTDAGLRRLEAAKADGSWAALDSVEALEIPPDLAVALAGHAEAAANFAAFPRSAKRAILEWIGLARTDATRSRRIAETAAKAALNERANQWRRS